MSRFATFPRTNRYGVVYVVTCKITGKLYVGKTTCWNPLARWTQHKQLARDGMIGKFHDAIRLHGAENFEFNVVASAINNRVIRQLEMEFIKELNSEVDGYNTMGQIYF